LDWAWGKEAQFRSDVVPQVGLDEITKHIRASSTFASERSITRCARNGTPRGTISTFTPGIGLSALAAKDEIDHVSVDQRIIDYTNRSCLTLAYL
jgi:hypothetical protein